MERNRSYSTDAAYSRPTFTKRIIWSAVFAGVLVAIVCQLLLTLLGLGIGFGSIDPVTEQNPAAGLGIGSAVWYAISSLLSLFAGGWVAGRLASSPQLFDGIIHGVLTWSLVTLITIYFLTTTIGSLIGGAGRLLGGIARTAGSVASAAGPQLGQVVKGELAKNGIDLNNIDLGGLRREVNTILRQTGDPALRPDALKQKAERAGDQAQNTVSQAAENPRAAGAMVDGLFDRLFKQGQTTVSQVDRDDAVNVVMKRTGKSRAESEQIVSNWITTYKQAAARFEQTKQEAVAKARQAADAAASAAAKAAIFGFFGLLIGVAASGYGAKMGTESKDELLTKGRSNSLVN
jgi:ElaB/YqjD/DUF883 family membrane-anchored ribosome-binding protein